MIILQLNEIIEVIYLHGQVSFYRNKKKCRVQFKRDYYWSRYYTLHHYMCCLVWKRTTYTSSA